MRIDEVLQAAEVLRAAQTTAKVAWLDDNSGRIMYGTARSIGNEYGSFARQSEDIRNQFLRITTQGGFETFLPVSDLMVKASKGEFSLYDWS